MAKQTQTASGTADDPAEAMKLRLREDLKSALRARDALETSVLRAIIAALDNAQAVPAHDKHVRYVVHEFGDRKAEVPRLRLDVLDVQLLLETEIRSRAEAADQFEQLGRIDRARKLREETKIVARYLIG